MLSAMGIAGAMAIALAVLVSVAGRAATEKQLFDTLLRVETRVWPLVGRIAQVVSPGISSSEREVWSYIVSEYSRGPKGAALPLAINPVAQWPTRERESPADLNHRIVDGRPPNEPGDPDAASAVQDFLLKSSRPVLLTKLKLPRASRFVEFQALANHNSERFGWEPFSGENGGVEGYLSLSRVGFNLFGTRAIVYVELFCGGLCGHGTYYVLERRSGKWQRVSDHLRWIS
jgi:hypothetical protein